MHDLLVNQGMAKARDIVIAGSSAGGLGVMIQVIDGKAATVAQTPFVNELAARTHSQQQQRHDVCWHIDSPVQSTCNALRKVHLVCSRMTSTAQS